MPGALIKQSKAHQRLRLAAKLLAHLDPEGSEVSKPL
jgi:hypothetical protein